MYKVQILLILISHMFPVLVTSVPGCCCAAGSGRSLSHRSTCGPSSRRRYEILVSSFTWIQDRISNISDLFILPQAFYNGLISIFKK